MLLPVGPAAIADESKANQYMHRAEFNELAKHFEDPGRRVWQKPDEVIAGLGRLTGKTVADIGAGTGYFAFPIAKKGAHVIAIEIDQRFLDYIAHRKQSQKTKGTIETRLTQPDTPGLKPDEADIVLIVDTFHHIEQRPSYLKKVKKGLRRGGSLVIVDFKKEATPVGPPPELRVAAKEVEVELRAAGFAIDSVDNATLPYQYIIRAR
jgi:2-polyprenyl-3-methyl-5-hydroxy-6-metoxy-1,4-benzoquinol methylase